MIRSIAISVNRVPIRLLDERWDDICGYCDDVLETIERPDYIALDAEGALVALREMANNRYLRVTYVELSSEEGYILSASCTDRVNRRAIIWARRYQTWR